jgi:peptidyl-Lys metalloendopeptidase
MKGKNITIALVLVLLLSALIGTTGAGAAPKSALSVTISADKASYSASDAVMLTVTITNTGKNTAKVLKWFTPAEDVEEALFKVSANGSPVAYTGAHYKRPTPTGNDYVTLKSGESLTRTVDLSAFYDLTASGVYEIEYDADAFGMASNKVQVAVEGRAAPEIVVVPEAVSGSTSFTKCTTSQQADLTTARANASTYAANALSYLNSINSSTQRYAYWFGTYSSANDTKVTSNFSKISSAMDTASVTFNCGCKKSAYAYVYSNQPYTIYLCRAFWTAPALGTDSKAGTLIHEMSHFTVVAGTNDYAYGQSAAHNLALTNVSQAIANADNHEYFAENTPALP